MQSSGVWVLLARGWSNIPEGVYASEDEAWAQVTDKSGFEVHGPFEVGA